MSKHDVPEEQQTPATNPEAQGATEEPYLEIMGSRQLTSWMAEQRCSFLFTTYQSGKVFLVGIKEEGSLSIFERTFQRCMGLTGDSETFYMSSLYQIWRFDNVLQPGQLASGYDRLYVPQMAYTTGDIDAHDMAIDKEGRLIFMNTLFSCMATLSESHSFKVLWQPKFISKLAAEDRCHLNGLAMIDGEPRYVTAVAETDVNEGWRDHRDHGGVVIDVQTDEIIAQGLSMPHSPRWYRDKLWLLNSGTGYFGYLDIESGQFHDVAFCPGYARGLDFIGDFAVIGLSRIRDNRTFSDLPIAKALESKKIEARCGLQVVDLRSGDVVHTLNIQGFVEELYDVVLLRNVARPMALGLKTDEIRRTISLE